MSFKIKLLLAAVLAAALAGWVFPGGRKTAKPEKLQENGSIESVQPGADNKLGGEKSRYLKLHADNPINWQPWGAAALARAKTENKPIFLSIGFYGCHWCGVMERESFTDPRIARLLNDNFISIKIDREQHPDIDMVYQTAMRLMRNRGGWPLSIFLTPDGKPFGGGTYYPHVDRQGRPVFGQLLAEIGEAWKTDRRSLDQEADRLYEKLADYLVGENNEGKVASYWEQVESAIDLILESLYDRENGGFGNGAKFPQPSMLLFMTGSCADKNESCRAAIDKTLQAIIGGGLHDHIGGGFFRYTTDRNWRNPHYEKMLYDQALLLQLFAEAYRRDPKPAYRFAAAGIAEFVRRELTGSNGLFFAEIGSEFHEVEGGAYLWTEQELADTFSTDERERIKQYFQFSKAEDAKRGALPFLNAEVAERIMGDQKTAEALLIEISALEKLMLVDRNRRGAAPVDDKSIVAWNGIMIAALARAGSVFDKVEYLDLAEKAAAGLTEIFERDKKLPRFIADGENVGDALLEDYAALALGYVELVRAGRDKYRSPAKMITRLIADRFFQKGGDNYGGGEVLPGIKIKVIEESSTPAGVSLAARAFSIISKIDKLEFSRYADQIFRDYSSGAVDRNISAPYMLFAMAEFISDSKSAPPANWSGESSDKVTMELLPYDETERRKIRLALSIEEGWYIYPAGPADGFSQATEVSLMEGGAPAEAAIDYPEPDLIKLNFGGKSILGYRGALGIVITRRANSAGEENAEAELEIKYQACSISGSCLRPKTEILQLPRN